MTVAGVLLIALGLGLLAAEAHVASFGVLAVAGIAALVAGGLVLYDADADVLEIAVPVAVATGVALGGFALFAGSRAADVRRRPPRGGAQELIGARGDVRMALDPIGQVYVDGALWRARCDQPLPRGQRIRVADVDGLTLTVLPDPKESP